MKHQRITLPDDLHARLKARATHHGHMTHMIRTAVREYLDRLDLQDKGVDEDQLLQMPEYDGR